MEMRSMESSDLSAVGYESATQTLRIRFHSGGVYDYFNVPESVYLALMGADSHGKFFHAHIKDRYRYQRVT